MEPVRSRLNDRKPISKGLAGLDAVVADGRHPVLLITDKAVCDELGVTTRQFRRWRDELQLLGNDAFPGQGRSRDEELVSLKRELAQVKKERDILKEATAYFARESK